jgi:hypothetical protein
MPLSFLRMFRNIGTTLAGIAAITATLSHMAETKSITFTDLAALSAGAGLLKAKDSNVTGGTKPNVE